MTVKTKTDRKESLEVRAMRDHHRKVKAKQQRAKARLVELDMELESVEFELAWMDHGTGDEPIRDYPPTGSDVVVMRF